MKIATYNVNGIGARLPALIRWLAESVPAGIEGAAGSPRAFASWISEIHAPTGFDEKTFWSCSHLA
jgi:hypothetical protein